MSLLIDGNDRPVLRYWRRGKARVETLNFTQRRVRTRLRFRLEVDFAEPMTIPANVSTSKPSP